MGRKKNTPEKFWEKVDRSGGVDACWLWTGGKNSRGYGQSTFGGVNWSSHRLAAYLSGMAIDGLCVCHRCDNPPCVNPNHLFVGTISDNNKDMMAKGRTATGESHGSYTKPEAWKRGDSHWARLNPEKVRRGEDISRAKLKEHQIPEIRALCEEGNTYAAIARSYGVSPQTISNIKRGKVWAHSGGACA